MPSHLEQPVSSVGNAAMTSGSEMKDRSGRADGGANPLGGVDLRRGGPKSMGSRAAQSSSW